MAAFRAPVLALTAIGFWSTNAIVAHWLLQRYPVSNVQFLQFLGAALLFALARRREDKERSIRPAVGILLVGNLGLVGTMVLQYLAFATIPVIEANLIAYSWPLFLAATFIAIGQTRRPIFLAGASVVGFAGVAMIIVDGAQLFTGGSAAGYVYAIGSALCMTFYSVAVGRSRVSPARFLLPASLTGLLGSTVWMGIDGVALDPSVYLLGGLYLGIGPMGFGYLFWSLAMRSDSSGQTSLIGYLTPVTSSMLLWLAGERLGPIGLTGALLTVGCCLAVGIRLSPQRTYRDQSVQRIPTVQQQS